MSDLDNLLSDLGGFTIPDGGPTDDERAAMVKRVHEAANGIESGTSWKEAAITILRAAMAELGPLGS